MKENEKKLFLKPSNMTHNSNGISSNIYALFVAWAAGVFYNSIGQIMKVNGLWIWFSQ